MADDIQITPGAGAAVATDEIAGRHYQVTKPAFGPDGSATLVSTDAPLPVAVQTEILESLRALQILISQLTRTLGQTMPDAVGRVRVSVDAIQATTLSNVLTVGTVTTVTNTAQIGGYSAADHVAATMHLSAACIRQQILVS